MSNTFKYMSAGVLLTVAGSAIAGESYVARNAAMGGVGVASSKYEAASTANPALLTQFREEDDWALIIPAFAGITSDEDDVVDTLDSIADEVDGLEDQIASISSSSSAADVAAALGSKDAILAELAEIDGVPAGAQLSGLISFSKPGKSLGWAVGLQTYVEGGALAIYDENDEQLINQAIADAINDLNPGNWADSLQSSGVGLAAGVTELTLSLAHEFNVGGTRLSVGITPKFQRVDTVFYEATVNDFNSDDADFDSDQYANDDSGINLDFGVSWWLTEQLNFGLMVRDIISEEYATNSVDGTSAVYNVDTQATLGAAWSSRLFTVAMDIDLLKNETFSDFMINGVPVTDIPSDTLLFGETQFVRLGAEFNAFDWAQLRAGFRTDLESTRDDLYSVGLGFSPFDVFHFDLTGFIGENDTYGGMVELKLTF